MSTTPEQRLAALVAPIETAPAGAEPAFEEDPNIIGGAIIWFMLPHGVTDPAWTRRTWRLFVRDGLTAEQRNAYTEQIEEMIVELLTADAPPSGWWARTDGGYQAYVGWTTDPA